MKIKESAENYLEAILMIKNRNGYVRSIDVANELNFTKPSVSEAMKTVHRKRRRNCRKDVRASSGYRKSADCSRGRGIGRL